MHTIVQHNGNNQEWDSSAETMQPICMCCVCMHLCGLCVLQAYRLEPLVNEAYANIRPVKMDSASSKPSKTALDHAEGPKSDQKLASQSGQSGSRMSSLISAVTNSKKQGPEPKQDKVCVHSKGSIQANVYGVWMNVCPIFRQIVGFAQYFMRQYHTNECSVLIHGVS